MDAVDAEHVGDLVGIGDNRRRAEREHEPGELVDEQLHGFEMHVRVDEAGDDVAPRGVDRLVAIVVTEPGYDAVHDGNVDPQPFPCEDRQHPSATHDDVGRLISSSNGDPAGEGLRHRQTINRSGQRRRFPLMTLSVGVVTTERKTLADYAQVAARASHMKRYFKTKPHNVKSRFAFDRREDL